MNTDKTVKVMNLGTGEMKEFDYQTDPKYATAYCYCEAEGEGLFLTFLEACKAARLTEFYETLPFLEGERTIACDDWCALKGGLHYGGDL